MIIYQGKIVTLSREKGFGFVRVQSFERDIYFHEKNIADSHMAGLAIGDEVDVAGITSALKNGRKQYSAVKVYVKY